MQPLQKRCPHGVCTASRRAIRQIGHSYLLSKGGSNSTSYPCVSSVNELGGFPVPLLTLTLSSFAPTLQALAMAAQQPLSRSRAPQLLLLCSKLIVADQGPHGNALKSSVPAISKAPSDSLELYITRQQCLLHAEIIPSHGRLELHPRDEAYFFSSSLSPRICYTSTSSTSTSFTVKAPVYSKYKPNHQTTFQQLLEAQCRNYEFNPMELNTSTQNRKTRISA